MPGGKAPRGTVGRARRRLRVRSSPIPPTLTASPPSPAAATGFSAVIGVGRPPLPAPRGDEAGFRPKMATSTMRRVAGRSVRRRRRHKPLRRMPSCENGRGPCPRERPGFGKAEGHGAGRISVAARMVRGAGRRLRHRRDGATQACRGLSSQGISVRLSPANEGAGTVESTVASCCKTAFQEGAIRRLRFRDDCVRPGAVPASPASKVITAT